MEEQDILISEVRLGLQTKEFLNTPVGQYISGRVEKAKEEAFEMWSKCDPTDAETIRELQFRARLPSLIMEWLDQAINQANHAEEILTEIGDING